MNTRARAAAAAILLAGIGIGLAGCAPEPGEAASTAGKEAATQEPGAGTAEGSGAASGEDSGKDSGKDSGEESGDAAGEQPAAPKLEQGELDRRLRDAAWANDTGTARQLIAWGADVNAVDETVQSAYLIATSEGRMELLRLTLKHNADVAALDSWQGTGLIRAAERGHWDISGELIRAGVAVDHVNNLGYQAVHEAVWLGRDDPSYHATLRVLAAGGATLDTLSITEGLTPLQMAEQRGFAGSSAILRTLTETPPPADPAAALLDAARAGDADTVALALRAGADPATADAAGVSARRLAEDGGHPLAAQIIRALGG